MADNYLEKKMEALQERKAKEARQRQIAWKKRMDAYRKKLENEKTDTQSFILSRLLHLTQVILSNVLILS